MTDGLRAGAASRSGRRRGGGQLPSWFGLPFLLGGVLMGAFGFILLQDELRFGREGVSVPGVVLETIYSPGGGDNGPSYSIRYEFVDPATGIRREGESDVSEYTYDTSVAGDPVEVTYIPAEPTKSRLGSPEPQLLVPLAVMGGGAIFLLVGGGLLLLTRYIRRNGAPSWVTISSGSDSDDEAPPAETENALAAFLGSDDKAPPPTTNQPPLSEAELRALDARHAPPAIEASEEPPKPA